MDVILEKIKHGCHYYEAEDQIFYGQNQNIRLECLISYP
jgi:hypothetical protein